MNAEQELKILDQPDYFKLWQDAELRCIELEARVDFYRQIAAMNADTIKSMTAARTKKERGKYEH